MSPSERFRGPPSLKGVRSLRGLEPAPGGDATRRRFLVSAGLLTLLVLVMGGAFWWLGSGEYSLLDAIYFVLITVSTVGYGELPGMQERVDARLLAMVTIAAGVALVAFFQSALTTLMVEGVIGKTFRRRLMDRRIAALSGHTIVAGCGRTGRFVVEELMASHSPLVVIDRDSALLEHLSAHHGGRLLYVVGDATLDRSLIAAGIARASGLITALTDDPDNVFVTISARSLNPRVRIVAKAVTPGVEAKLERAGANATVSPHRIGGLQLVTELCRPHTAEFLDSMMRGTGEGQLRFDDVEVSSRTPYEGMSLREIPIRAEANVLIVAIRYRDGQFVYNPPADQRLESGAFIVVLGTRTGIARLREMMGTAA